VPETSRCPWRHKFIAGDSIPTEYGEELGHLTWGPITSWHMKDPVLEIDAETNLRIHDRG
jgi:hypothetical protein